MAKIPTLDSRRVIVLTLVSTGLILWGLSTIGNSVLIEMASKTVLESVASRIVGVTGVFLICSALLVLTILLAAALIIKELRIHNALSRQLLKSYGREPEA